MWLLANKTVGSGRRCCFAFSCGRGCLLEFSFFLSPANFFFLDDGSLVADGCRVLVRRWTAFDAEIVSNDLR